MYVDNEKNSSPPEGPRIGFLYIKFEFYTR